MLLAVSHCYILPLLPLRNIRSAVAHITSVAAHSAVVRVRDELTIDSVRSGKRKNSHYSTRSNTTLNNSSSNQPC